MTTLRISEAAVETGLPASTLRYYDKIGLVSAGTRTPAGYRSYGPDDVALLRFVAQAKGLGLSLDEIRQLAALWAGGACQPVQAHLLDLLAEQAARAEAQILGLRAFIDHVRTARGAIRQHTPNGRCDDRCACIAEPGPASEASTAIACTLPDHELPERLATWAGVVAEARATWPTDDGVTLAFGPDVNVDQVVALAQQEQACCAFFTFTLRIEPPGLTLEITAPPAARQLVDALLGLPA